MAMREKADRFGIDELRGMSTDRRRSQKVVRAYDLRSFPKTKKNSLKRKFAPKNKN